MHRPDLTQAEIDAICDGLSQYAAQCRYLRRMGLLVERRPNGQPLVARSEWERRRVSSPATTTAGAGNAPKWQVAA